MKEHRSRTRKILGYDGIQQSRRNTALDNDAAEATRRSEILVVVKGISIAGQLGEELDVSGGHHLAAPGIIPNPHGFSSPSAVHAPLVRLNLAGQPRRPASCTNSS